MGRPYTGAATCEGAQRIEMSKLLKIGLLKRGEENTSIFTWGNNTKIGIRAIWLGQEKFLEMRYIISSGKGEKEYRRFISIESVPSNLGKGEVLYFICPITRKRCRVLYRAYGSEIWKSREAYQNRLYYKSQISSKMDYANDRYWALNRKLDNIYEGENFRLSYDGKPTRSAKYIESLEERQAYWDRQRLRIDCFPLSLRKYFQ